MSKIQVNEIVNHFDNGAPDCPRGLTVTGVSTFSGNVSIGGTLTYEDVTNIDSVGIITAQSGINVVSGTGAGVTAIVTEALYSASGDVDIQSWARQGGAVKAAMTYNDTDTHLRFGGTTSQDFNIIQNNTRRLILNNDGGVAINTTFPGAAGTDGDDQKNVTVGNRLITLSQTTDSSTRRAAAICEFSQGASGTYTGIAVSFNGNNSNTTALIEVLLHGYSNRYVQFSAVKYSTQSTIYPLAISKDGVTTVTESGTANSDSRWCYDFSGSFVHPVVKIKATVGGLATRFEHPPEITFYN